MIELIDALRNLLEPDKEAVTHDDSGAQPNEWKANTIYAYPTVHRWVPMGTGAVDHVGEMREDFEIRIVYTISNPGEEPSGRRDRDVTVALDAKAEDYLTKVALHEALPPWDNLTATVDHDFLRQFEVRGISLVCTGYRLRSS